MGNNIPAIGFEQAFSIKNVRESKVCQSSGQPNYRRRKKKVGEPANP
jgi:hypothetical protein